MNTFKMTKARSPHVITFKPDSDPFFCNVEMRKRKTGTLVASHYILSSDVRQWREMYEKEGFHEITEGAK